MTARAGRREAVRRAAVLGILAVWLACGIVVIVATGEYWTLVGWGGWAVVGAVILFVRPGNPIGRLLLGIGTYWTVSGLLLIPEVARLVPVWLDLFLTWSGYPVWMSLSLLLALFPTGRVESTLGRVVWWVYFVFAAFMLVAVAIAPVPMEATGQVSPFAWPDVSAVTGWLRSDASMSLVVAATALALVELALRWRRATGARRLQFRWLGYGAAFTILLVALLTTSPEIAPGAPQWTDALVVVSVNAIPVCIGVAVTRHGLYEIGRVVSRTVSYALVTALVVGVYAAVVTSLSQLIPGSSSLAVAAATLVAAAVFLPALRFVRSFIDRRFDRERYDAAKVVDAFGKRLRTEVDPTTTTGDLLAAVEQTLQPAAVGLWTAGDSR